MVAHYKVKLFPFMHVCPSPLSHRELNLSWDHHQTAQNHGEIYVGPVYSSFPTRSRLSAPLHLLLLELTQTARGVRKCCSTSRDQGSRTVQTYRQMRCWDTLTSWGWMRPSECVCEVILQALPPKPTKEQKLKWSNDLWGTCGKSVGKRHFLSQFISSSRTILSLLLNMSGSVGKITIWKHGIVHF